MKNITHQPTEATKAAESAYIAEDKRAKSIHKQPIYRGHNLYEVDIDEETIRIMPIEKIAVIGKGVLPNTKMITHNKVLTKPNCLYISCLNIKNLKRLIDNAGGKDISSYKIL